MVAILSREDELICVDINILGVRKTFQFSPVFAKRYTSQKRPRDMGLELSDLSENGPLASVHSPWGRKIWKSLRVLKAFDIIFVISR